MVLFAKKGFQMNKTAAYYVSKIGFLIAFAFSFAWAVLNPNDMQNILNFMFCMAVGFWHLAECEIGQDVAKNTKNNK